MRMPLILAIEPDRRQASKITTLARTQLQTEIVIADSTERALAAIAWRVPDLILTSALLSPKDEAVLTDRLRELDAAGTRVQTLVVPVLGVPGRRSHKASRGLLTRLRGAKGKDAAPDGCDPSVFGAQIAQYLEGIAAERRAAATAIEDNLPATADPVYATRLEAESARPEPQRRQRRAARDRPAVDAAPAPVVHEAQAPVVHEAQAPVVHEAQAPVLQEAPPVQEAPPPIHEAPPQVEEPPPVLVQTAEVQVASAPEPHAIENDWREVEVDDDAPSPVTTADAVAAEPEQGFVITAETIDLAAFVEELEAAAPPAPVAPPPPPAQAAPPRARRVSPQVETRPEPAVAKKPPAPKKAPGQPALGDVLTALQLDLVHMRTEPAGAVTTAPSKPSATTATPNRTPPTPTAPGRERVRQRKRKKNPTPVQDEWGFFDPQQCGFTALLAKLDEVTEQEHAPAKKPA